MTWQGKRRKQLPSNWGSLRKARLEYDGYRCTAVVANFDKASDRATIDEARRLQEAGDTLGWQRLLVERMRCPARATEVDHHLDPHDHRLEALRSLCHAHHMAKTQAEANEARATRKRTTQPHPGLR